MPPAGASRSKQEQEANLSSLLCTPYNSQPSANTGSRVAQGLQRGESSSRDHVVLGNLGRIAAVRSTKESKRCISQFPHPTFPHVKESEDRNHKIERTSHLKKKNLRLDLLFGNYGYVRIDHFNC